MTKSTQIANEKQNDDKIETSMSKHLPDKNKKPLLVQNF